MGSWGIPKPLAIRSFFEKFAATAEAAGIAAAPNTFSNAFRAVSKADLSVSTKASENLSNSLPPGTPISRSG